MNKRRSDIVQVTLICLLLTLLVVVVYGQTINHEFVDYDDNDYITENLRVRDGLTRESVVWAFTTTLHSHWHPVTWLSHMTVCELCGLNPGGHHLVNLLLHLANSLLLFIVLRGMTGTVWRSAMVAALFALHPMNVESVAWITGRKDVLSTFFLMLTMWSYVLYVKRPGVWKYLLCILFFCLGLMTKSMLVTVPGVLLLLDYWPLDRLRIGFSNGNSGHGGISITRLVLEKVPFFLLSAALGIVTVTAFSRGMATDAMNTAPLVERVVVAVVHYWEYLGKMVWPAHLAFTYPHPDAYSSLEIFGGWAFLVCTTALVLWSARRLPYLVVGWLWFLGTFVPVIGVLQAGEWGMADRYAYVPFMGVFIIIVWGVYDIVARWRWRFRKQGLIVLAVALLSAMTVTSWFQTSYWEDDFTLCRHALDVTAGKANVHNNLGVALEKAGQTDEAIRHYQEAIRRSPNYRKAHYNLGIALEGQGRTDEAMACYQKVLRIDPNQARTRYSLGNVLTKEGRTNKAIRQGIEASWVNARTHNNMGVLLAKEGKVLDAMAHFSEALHIIPNFVEAHNNIGLALAMRNRISEALEHFREALRVDPRYENARCNLGNVLLQRGNFGEAIRHYQEVLRIDPEHATAGDRLREAQALRDEIENAILATKEEIKHNPDNPALYGNMGLLYRRKGDLDRATGQYRQALLLDPDSVRIMNDLVAVYVTQKKNGEALSIFKRLAELQPDNAGNYYNIACMYARQGKEKEALDSLRIAIDRGYNNWELVRTDRDLDSIRGLPGYIRLIAEHT